MIRSYLKSKTKWWIIKKASIVLCVFFLFYLIVSLPYMIVEELSNSFYNWFNGQNKSYATVNDAMLEWIDTLDESVDIGDDYMPREWIKKYIQADKDSVFQNISLTLKEKVSTDISYDDPDRSGSYDVSYNDVNYVIQLHNATKDYNMPWQTLVTQHSLSDMLFNEATFDNMLNMFGTTYYGLLDGNGAVTKDMINSNSNFKFKKYVKKTTVVTSEYYKKIKNEETGEIEEDGPYTKTVTTESYIEYPLPYFTNIITMLNTHSFEYETKKEVSHRNVSMSDGDASITIEIIEPVLKDKDSTVDIERYIANLDSINIQPNDIGYMSEIISKLPNGPLAASVFDWFLDDNYVAYDGSMINPSDLYMPGNSNLTFTYPTMNSYLSRDDVISVSKSILGLYYFWGGKYPKIGFNDNWGKLRLVTAANNRNTGKYIPYGLDCSGFVDWVYYQLTGEVLGKGGGTGSQFMYSTPIKENELKIGDLGFYANPYLNGGSAVHVGIFIGRDSDGRAMFIHSGGSHYKDAAHPNGQVIVSKQGKAFNGYPSVRFKYFCRTKYKFAD